MSNTEETNQGGRPEFVPTDKQRDDVEIGVYTGMTHVQLAAALEISRPTLEKHFADELLAGHSKKRLENMVILFTLARQGNASMAKQIERMGAMVVAPRQPDLDQSSKKPDPLGKKEELNIAAKEPPPEGSKWSGLLN